MSVFFKKPEHKTRFVSIMEELHAMDPDGALDQEYSACLYILTSDAWTWDVIGDYIRDDGIYIDKILEDIDFSSGYRVLMLLAGNLYNGHNHIDPVEFTRLDQENRNVAVQAILFRLGRYNIKDFMIAEDPIRRIDAPQE